MRPRWGAVPGPPLLLVCAFVVTQENGVLTAGDSRLEERLVVLARWLAAGALTEDEVSVGSLETLVAALHDVGPLHLAVLRSLVSSSNTLGLGGDDPAFDEPVHSLNRMQLNMVFPEIRASLKPVLALLQRHGLIEVLYPNSATLGRGSAEPSGYRITDFGRMLLDELTAASAP